MPSVNELLAALESDKSPFTSLLEGVAGGYATAQQNRIQNARALLEMDQKRQEMEQARQIRQHQIAEDLRIRTEQQTSNALRATGVSAPVVPQMKMKRVVEEDPKTGLMSEKKTYETEDPKPSEFYTPDQARALVPGDQTENLIKSFPSGQIPKDSVHQLVALNKPSPFQVVGSQDGSLVAVNPKSLKATTVSLPGRGPLTSTTQSDSQANAKLFASRMEDANNQISKLSTLTDLTSASAGIQSKFPNVAKSPDIQSFEQAKRNFINAVLRRESGAVISPTEFSEGNQQYFPTFGDSAEVLKQKELNRQTAIEGLRNAAGEVTPHKGIGTTRKIGRFTVEVQP